MILTRLNQSKVLAGHELNVVRPMLERVIATLFEPVVVRWQKPVVR